MHHYLDFVNIMTLTPFDFLEVKWFNSHIFFSFHEFQDLGTHIEERQFKYQLVREDKMTSDRPIFGFKYIILVNQIML